MRAGENVVVPEAQDPKALRPEERIAAEVIRIVRMLRTIRFDDQPLIQADEVDDKRIYHLLSAKLEG
jgi:hypothetical protein